MKELCAIVLLGALVACGGGSDGGPPTTPQVPTPPPVSYNGTYTGTSMTFTGGGGRAIVTAFTRVTQSGSSCSFGDMVVTSPVSLSFGMGPATLIGNNFDGTSQYVSSGCGMMTNHYRGYFSGDGNVMNMTMTLTSPGCGDFDIRGEMRR